MGKSKFAICALIKNEHRYLKEWIVYNLSIGFDEIFLYEDVGSESHNSIADKYKNVCLIPYSVVSRTEYDGKDFKQMDMVNHFLSLYKGDWVAFIDPDEYIRFADGYDLNKLTSEFHDENGVYLFWRMIGSCGRLQPVDTIQDSYHYEGHKIGNIFRKLRCKTLMNVNGRGGMRNIHKVRNGIYTNGNRVVHEPIYDKAYIDHYFTKSFEDWLERFEKRGDVVEGNRRMSEFFDVNPKERGRCIEYYERTRGKKFIW